MKSQPRADRIAVLGSSLIANAISAQYLSELVSDDVIQLAVGGQGLQEQALIWELYLARHRCDVLVLELHDESLQRDAIPDPMREDRYAAHLDNTIVRRHIAKYCGWTKTLLWQYVPMYAFAEFSSKIGWQDWVGVAKGEPYDAFASAIYAESKPLPFAIADKRVQAPKNTIRDTDPSAREALRSILESAKLAGIRVVILEPPIYRRANDKVMPPAELLNQSSVVSPTDIELPEIRSLKKIAFSIASQQDPAMFDDTRHASKLGSRYFTKELTMQLF